MKKLILYFPRDAFIKIQDDIYCNIDELALEDLVAVSPVPNGEDALVPILALVSLDGDTAAVIIADVSQEYFITYYGEPYQIKIFTKRRKNDQIIS